MATACTTSKSLLSKVMYFKLVSQTNVIIINLTWSFLAIEAIQIIAPLKFDVNQSGKFYIDP